MHADECACPCLTVRLEVKSAPQFRMFCHCTICQRFNDAPFADVLVYRARDIGMPAPESVEFATYKPPPNVQRGKCVNCGAAAIETFHVPLLPGLTMVPRSMHAADADLPAPIAHVFYETRVADADDALPKHKGFLPSQLAFLKYLLGAKSARRGLG